MTSVLTVDGRLDEKRLGKKKFSYTNQWHTDISPLIDPPAASDATRVLYRTTLEGEVPVGVDGEPSRSISGARFDGSAN